MASIVKVLRILHNDNQQEIAKLLGTTVTTYNRKENEKSKFTLDEAKLIAARYNVSLDKLMNENAKDYIINVLQ